MLKKLAVSLGALAMVFGFFFGSEAYAAEFGPASWRTEDGKYELTVVTSSSQNDVWVYISDIYRVNYNSGAADPNDPSPLSVRLCSASTGNCTAFKRFTSYDGLIYAGFFNMIPGTYYVDIRDDWPSYYFKGQVYAQVVQYDGN